MGYDLWPRPYRLRSFAGGLMRISDDIRRCVVFIGHAPGPGESTFRAEGTGFLIEYGRHVYLVTTQHIAAKVDDAPFGVRINKKDGTSDTFHIDLGGSEASWFFHTQDETVDLAVLPITGDLATSGYDAAYVPTYMLADKMKMEDLGIGAGDLCYAVGLFRLMAGTTRNVPVAHTGSISLMPSDEKIPVEDWVNSSGNHKYVEEYLIELQNLKGLSGAPVFVRPSILALDVNTNKGETVKLQHYQHRLFLLGIWQSSWDAQPSEVIAVERGRGIRVPVGMGTVVPSSKLLELLELPLLVEDRKKYEAEWDREKAARLDATGN